MLHPSYSDLMEVANENVEIGEEPVVKSRYSIVIATSKRARQLIDGDEVLVHTQINKPLSVAVEEFYQGKIFITAKNEIEF
ncbi:DNA-directed RNA polymerase subunit omega [Natranaerovirga hydrolytica]|uniref:DNA-directed RNA polymerase subunit omega n=1 Tax=Natranaerovirga hydrolytica TaxID=680378 RepID=A0A4R1N0B8_9FIRM|nr:DNA-directed RNA polymerase subunit omega [Natranaerovirga hydrolytica]TCK98340.1 DNA-directed RNA polymerase subunit omega [Natranaerovirga hydrolytica]